MCLAICPGNRFQLLAEKRKKSVNLEPGVESILKETHRGVMEAKVSFFVKSTSTVTVICIFHRDPWRRLIIFLLNFCSMQQLQFI